MNEYSSSSQNLSFFLNCLIFVVSESKGTEWLLLLIFEGLQNHGLYNQDHGEAFPALRPMTNCSQVCTGLIACCSNAVQLVGPTGSMPFIGVQQMEMPFNFTALFAFNPMVKGSQICFTLLKARSVKVVD